MREIVEFRVPAENAEKLPPGTAEDIGYGVTKVVVERDQQGFSEICRLHRAFLAQGKHFFSGWEYHRRYSRQEFEQSRLFHIWPKKAFEPSGEECGTVYDETSGCDYVFALESHIEVSGRSVSIPRSTCGAGARQVTALILDGRRIPRVVDFARSIADELVVSRRTVEAFREQKLTGVEFDPIQLSNEDGTPSQDHYQLRIVGAPVELDDATRAGSDPCDAKRYGECPRGHIVGLNLLSEITVVGHSLGEADIMATRQLVGVRRGLLRPGPILLASQKAWRAIEGAKLKGLTVEIALIS